MNFDLYSSNLRDSVADYSDRWSLRKQETRGRRVFIWTVTIFTVLIALVTGVCDWWHPHQFGEKVKVPVPTYDETRKDLAKILLEERKRQWAKEIEAWSQPIVDRQKWLDKTSPEDLLGEVEKVYPDKLEMEVTKFPTEAYRPGVPTILLYSGAIIGAFMSLLQLWRMSDFRKRLIIKTYIKIHEEIQAKSK